MPLRTALRGLRVHVLGTEVSIWRQVWVCACCWDQVPHWVPGCLSATFESVFMCLSTGRGWGLSVSVRLKCCSVRLLGSLVSGPVPGCDPMCTGV